MTRQTMGRLNSRGNVTARGPSSATAGDGTRDNLGRWHEAADHDRQRAPHQPAPWGDASGQEHVAIDEALDRVLAAERARGGDVPPFACSAMDGYAVRAGPRAGAAVVGESRAGAPSELALGAGEAIRISTGAAIPAGADAVIRQEDVTLDDGGDAS